MADLEKLRRNLEAEGFTVSCFGTAAQAADYLDAALDGKTIGIGGSVTIRDMGLAERLSTHARVYWHWNEDALEQAASAQVYLTSVNGLAETGELINIDGTGNRVASGLYGHEKVYFVVGRNKVAPDYDAALWRARNIAAPKNAQRLQVRTPCAAKGDKCYDCKSPDRICRALVVYWEKPKSMDMEVVLIDEDLGY
ncbi:lactate utilization protein [uncultured Intestinimonas sp.]|uniref:lactate utilization protein n=1 Tax=uncultured Intestinimonas sp. TaxID=1689265 RepID=UPI0025D9E6B6|nr:lactate utilization protein [uncultured Intestinimonas sp.]